jgi:hypothetical protein
VVPEPAGLFNHDRFYACLASGLGRERLFSPGFRATSRRARRDGSKRVLGSWSTRSRSAKNRDKGHVEHAQARLALAV